MYLEPTKQENFDDVGKKNCQNDGVFFRLISDLRAGRGHGVQQEILDKCETYVKNGYGRICSPEDCEEIASEAVLELLEIIEKEPERGVALLTGDLKRILNKLKRRAQRRQEKDNHKPLEEWDVATSNLEKEIIASDLVLSAVEEIFDAMERRLPDLNIREHDLLVEHYSLEGFFPLRGFDLMSLKPECKRKAVYRARRCFGCALEEDLAQRSSPDPQSLKLAREIVAGECFLAALELIPELI